MEREKQNTRDQEHSFTTELKISDALQEMLNSNSEAKAVWEALTPSRQREILTYLNFLKTQAALERNVQKAIADSL